MINTILMIYVIIFLIIVSAYSIFYNINRETINFKIDYFNKHVLKPNDLPITPERLFNYIFLAGLFWPIVLLILTISFIFQESSDNK